MFSKFFAAIKKSIFGPSQKQTFQRLQMAHLVRELLKFLEDYQFSEKEKNHIIQEAEQVLANNNQEPDLRSLASQILDNIKDNKLTKKEWLQLKSKAYILLIDQRLEDD